MPRSISITGDDLTIEQFAQVVLNYTPVKLHPSARSKMEQSRALVERMAGEKRPVYGINGNQEKLSDARIDRQQIEELQLNLVRSHACGVGTPLTEVEVRGMMLCRANVLAKGYSGTRPSVVTRLLEFLNTKIHPVVPSQGSVGASGDLAPLAHLALALIGEGEAYFDQKRMTGEAVLRKNRLMPLQLGPKEGISLLNGTQGMLSLGTLALLSAETLVDTADVAASLSLDALKGTPTAFDDRIQRLRSFPGQARSAANVRKLNAGSQIRLSHLDCAKVQDAYSLRCVPQVHGAVRDTLAFARKTIEIELNAATDNPLVFVEELDNRVTHRLGEGLVFRGEDSAQAHPLAAEHVRIQGGVGLELGAGVGLVAVDVAKCLEEALGIATDESLPELRLSREVVVEARLGDA